MTQQRRISRPRMRRGGTRAKTRWLDSIVDQTVAQTVQVTQLLDQDLPDTQKKGAVVIRIIFAMSFRALTAGAFPQMVFGITMINADADAAGAFPDADVAGDQPGWMMRALVKATDGVDNPIEKYSADLRSKRAYRGADDNLKIILDNAAAASGSIIATGLIRTLIRLP